MLNIKPVLTIQGEKLDIYTKARGMTQTGYALVLPEPLKKRRMPDGGWNWFEKHFPKWKYITDRFPAA